MVVLVQVVLFVIVHCVSVMLLLAARLLLAQSVHDRGTLVAQSNPDPEPSQHLDEHKAKEDAVLEAVEARRRAVLKGVGAARVEGSAGAG